MRSTLALAAMAALGGAGLAAAVAVIAPQPFAQHTAGPAGKRGVWTEAQWPFPIDQWGTGKAFACGAADCGTELRIYLRAKIGFCNCETGVADDAELERVSDLELFGGPASALAPGRPVVFASMKGRSRAYAVPSSAGSNASALAIAVNDRCDVVVATAFIPNRRAAAWEPLVLAFLNEDRVRRWAEQTLGL